MDFAEDILHESSFEEEISKISGVLKRSSQRAMLLLATEVLERERFALKERVKQGKYALQEGARTVSGEVELGDSFKIPLTKVITGDEGVSLARRIAFFVQAYKKGFSNISVTAEDEGGVFFSFPKNKILYPVLTQVAKKRLSSLRTFRISLSSEARLFFCELLGLMEKENFLDLSLVCSFRGKDRHQCRFDDPRQVIFARERKPLARIEVDRLSLSYHIKI